MNLSVVFLVYSLLGEPRMIAWLAGLEASILNNYSLNRRFTFPDRTLYGIRGIVRQAGQYHLVTCFGSLCNLMMFTIVSLLGSPVLIAAAAGIAAGVSVNYVGASRLVFCPTIQSWRNRS